MIAVSVTDLRKDVEKYLDEVARGETLEVQRDGEPLAIVSPVKRRVKDYWKKPIEPLKIEGVSLSQLILEEREEGW